MRFSKRSTWVILLLGAGLLLGLALPAEATYYPLNRSTTGWYQYTSTTTYYTFGYRFMTQQGGLTVTQLGCYVPTPYNRNVRLWSDAGAILGQVTTTNTSGWHFTNLASPVSLSQGGYYIVTEYGPGYGYWYRGSWTGDTRILYIETRGLYDYLGTNGHQYPSTNYGTYTIYGGADIGYTVTPPPATPAWITVPASDYDGNYTVSWASSATATSYELQEDTSAGFINPQTIYSGPNLSYAVTNRPNGSYWYRVRACNIGGPSGWRVGTNPCVVTLLPAAPGALIVPQTSSTGNYFLQWSSVPTATDYELSESTNGGANWNVVYSGTGTSWSAVGQPDGSYWYRVRSHNVAGWCTTPPYVYGSYQGAPAQPAAPGSPVAVLRPPIAPPSVSVPFSDTDGVYPVSWTASTTPSVTYRMQEDTDPNFGSPTQLYLGWSTTFTVGAGSAPNGPRPNGTYYYRVRAENVAGPSGWTYGANGCTVQLPPPPAPVSISYEDPQGSPVVHDGSNPDPDGDFWVVWGSSPGATSYELEEATNPAFTGAQPVYSGTATSFHATGRSGLPPAGTTYYYRVRAWNSSGWSGWTQDLQGCLVIIPPPPTVGSIWISNTAGGAAAPNPDVDGNYFVCWSTTAGAVTFEVEEATDGSFTGSTLIFSSGGQSCPVTGKPNGTYWYRVRARNSSGTSPGWTALGTGFQVLLPPPAPGSITVPPTSVNGNYTVTWSTSVTASQYRLEEATDAGFATAVQVYLGAGTAYPVTGKPNGTYYYRVAAGNTSGWSGWTTGQNACVVLFPPTAPGSITVPATSSTGNYTVSWSASATATDYDLWESDDAKASWGTGPVYSGPLTSFNVTGKVSGTYWYRVRSRNASGPSAGFTESTNGCQIVAPPVPTGLSCPSTTPLGTWTVSWNPSSGTQTYTLEENDGSGWVVIYQGPNTSFVVTGKASGTFQYRVSAANGAGTSGWSGVVTCTMVSPSPPSSITVPATSISGYFTVSWAASAGATSYALEESTSGAGGPWSAPIFTGNATSFYVTGRQGTPSSPVTYWYRVTASNAVGSSAPTTSLNGCQVALQAPPPVSGITVPANSSTGSYAITWNATTGATGYDLQEATDPGFATAYTVYSGSSASFQVSGKSDGVYYYRVRSTNPAGVSGWTAGTNGCTVRLTLPLPPGNFVVPFSSFSGIYRLTWTSGAGSMWYEVEEDVDAAFGSPRVVYIGGSTACVLQGRPGGTYYYRVRSVNTVGHSGWVPGGNGCLVAVVSPAMGVFGGVSNPGPTHEPPSASQVPMLQLGLAAGTGGDLRIDDITFHGTGSGNESLGVSVVRLWEDADRDGVVSAGDRALGVGQVYGADDGSVTFSGLGEVLVAGTDAMWLVTYDFQPSVMQGEDYRVELNANGDVVVVDAMWGGTIVPSGAPVVGGYKTISTMGSGDLQVFVGPSSPAGATVEPGTTGQPVVQLNLVASHMESVDVQGVRFYAIGDGNDLGDVTGVRLVLDANGNGLAEGTEAVLGTGTYIVDNGLLGFTFASPVTVPSGGSVKLLVVYDFAGGIAGRWNYTTGVLSGGDVTTSGLTTLSPVAVWGPPVIGEYVTIDTPPAPEAKVDPRYSMGGCAPGSGGSPGSFVLPLVLLGGALWLSRRRSARARA